MFTTTLMSPFRKGLYALLPLIFLAGNIQPAAAAGIDMLPPAECTAGKAGVLGWDMHSSLACLRGFTVNKQTGDVTAEGFVQIGTAPDSPCNANNIGALRYHLSATQAEKDAGHPGNTIQFCAMKMEGGNPVYLWRSLMPICNGIPPQAGTATSVAIFCSSGNLMAAVGCMMYNNVVAAFNAKISEAKDKGDCDTAIAWAEQRNIYINSGGMNGGTGVTPGVSCSVETCNGVYGLEHSQIKEFYRVTGTEPDPKDPQKTIPVCTKQYCGCSNGKVNCWD